jgi:hypothetical protein
MTVRADELTAEVAWEGTGAGAHDGAPGNGAGDGPVATSLRAAHAAIVAAQAAAVMRRLVRCRRRDIRLLIGTMVAPLQYQE